MAHSHLLSNLKHYIQQVTISILRNKSGHDQKKTATRDGLKSLPLRSKQPSLVFPYRLRLKFECTTIRAFVVKSLESGIAHAKV